MAPQEIERIAALEARTSTIEDQVGIIFTRLENYLPRYVTVAGWLIGIIMGGTFTLLGALIHYH